MKSSKNTSITIDWHRFWNFFYRLVTGIGLVVFWIALLGATIALLAWLGLLISKLSFAWILGVGITIPIILCCWWLSYHIAIDSLSDIGINLNENWQWIIIPIALPLAPILFLFGSLSGFGEFVQGRVVTILSFSLGILIFLSLAIVCIRAAL